MNKERAKSFLLTFLVLMNFVLGIKVLTEKKLWPTGYNFFSLDNINLLKLFSSTNETKNTKTHLTMPQEIIINTGDQTSRIAVNSSKEIFYEIFSAAEECISTALSAETKEIVFSDKSEWVSVLNGKSVCLNYPAKYDMCIFGKLYNVDATALSSFVPLFSKIVVSQDNAVFFEDYKSGNFYKVPIRNRENNLLSLINKAKSLNTNNDAIINYAVDLKFDEAIGNQKMVLSPTIPVYSTPVSIPVLTSSNPLIFENGELNKEIADKILSVFKINSNTVRRYTEVNGTIVFVENNGILKIHSSGLIHYQSTASTGFNISSGSSYTSTLSAAADFADKVSAAFGMKQDLYLSGTVSENEKKINFDYRSGGIPVDTNIGNAISMEIKNGYMTSYTQYIRNYSQGNELYEAPLYIEELDRAIEDYSKDMNNIEICEMYLAYNDDNSDTQKNVIWKIKVKSIEF